jgi:hypothetical protein
VRCAARLSGLISLLNARGVTCADFTDERDGIWSIQIAPRPWSGEREFGLRIKRSVTAKEFAPLLRSAAGREKAGLAREKEAFGV